MRNKYNFNTLEELKAKQLALKSESIMHGQAILLDAKTYANDFSVFDFIKPKPKPALSLALKKTDADSMLSGKILSYGLPLLLNKTLFKGSGIITKTIVGMLSSKTGAKLGGLLVNYLKPKKK
ncbi:MAG: hypothetical protein EOO92_14250 [Pedobacter sp.]|nr:MAG: hypothetical protein EOO92_14250 [Pedobacter sp.]